MSNPDYYPQHFKKTRPYAKAWIEQLQAMEKRGGVNVDSAFGTASDLIAREYIAAGIRPEQFDRRAFSDETKAALMYAEWVMHGAALYEFEPDLVDALGATGIEEVALADLQFPFDCAYFHFGPRNDLVLHSGAKVTGAFLLRGGALRIALTAQMGAGKPWTERFEELYDLRILEQHHHKGLESAIAQAVQDDVEDLHRARAYIVNSSAPGTAGPALVAADAILRAHEANREAFGRCMQLIANALCYLTAYPDDVRNDWQVGTPEKMMAKAETGPPKEAARARSKLNAMGYRKLLHVGAEFAAASDKTHHGSVAPHWRRGTGGTSAMARSAH